MTVIVYRATSHEVAAQCPACNRCGSQTRLFGLEPHPTVERTDLRTYVCEACQGVQTEIVPLAR